MSKKTILLLFTFFVINCISLFSQNLKDSIKIPDAVKLKFARMHPDAVITSWGRYRHGYRNLISNPYIVDFTIGEKEGIMDIDSLGNLTHTYLDIPFNTLPDKIQSEFKKRYPRFILAKRFYELEDLHPHRKYYYRCLLHHAVELINIKGEVSYFIIFYKKWDSGYSMDFDGNGKYVGVSPYHTF